MNLNEICEVYSGYAFKEFHEDSTGNPVIKIGNITNNGSIDTANCSYTNEIVSDRYLSKDGDIYIALSGATTGKIGLMKKNNYCINQRVGVVRLLNKNIPINYLCYFLQSKTKKILSDAAGAAQPNISPKDISKYQFPKRKVDEMITISDVLLAIDNAIKVKKTELSNLNELIKSQFIEMFGDKFDGNRCFVGDIATPHIGLTYKPENVSENGTIVLRSGNIQNQSLQIQEDIVRVSNIKINDDKYIKDKDILMCARNGSARLVGKSCLIRNPKEKMAFGAFMTVIRTDYPYFLQGFFTSDYFKSQLRDVGTASVNQITSKMLNNYQTIEPTIEEENKFAQFCEQIDKSKFIVQKQIDDLQELLDSKMQEYFGEEE